MAQSRPWVYLALGWLVGTSALGQSKTSTIVGMVLDGRSDRPLPGARVVASSTESGSESSATTDASGEFRFEAMPVGGYNIHVDFGKYEPSEFPGLKLQPYARLRVNVALHVAGSRASSPVEFSEAMTPPKFLSGPDPVYTDKAIEREVEGTMVVKCLVSIEGAVRNCKALKIVPFMDKAVIDALEHRRYTPALQDGKPVEVEYTFKITLKLPR